MTEARHVVCIEVQNSVFDFVDAKIQWVLLKVDNVSDDSLSIPGCIFYTV